MVVGLVIVIPVYCNIVSNIIYNIFYCGHTSYTYQTFKANTFVTF